MDKNKPAFDQEELKLALEKGSIHDKSLNPAHIEEIAHDIFHKDGYVRQNRHKELIAKNYDGLDLIKHGFHHFITDLKLLTEFFREAVKTVQTTTSKRNRANSVLMMGCGPGRLAIPTIELAKKLQIKEIVFNDLLSEHIEITRETIGKTYGTKRKKIDGVSIEYLSGDFLEVSKDIRKMFDAIFAMWFVTPEIANFSSVEALREIRKNLYDQIKKLLSKQGVFIEEVPYSEGVGAFYYLVRLKTYAVLHKMGILEGENHNIIITDYRERREIQCPDHIRYAPANGSHNIELSRSNFESSFFRITTLPHGIKSLLAYEQEIGSSEKIKSLFSGNELDAIISYLDSKEKELLNLPHSSDPLAKKKKTTLWRQRL